MIVEVKDSVRGREELHDRGDAAFTIGRGAECEVRLDSRFVASRHVFVDRGPTGWELRVRPGAPAVEVDGRPVDGGQTVPLAPRAEVLIGEWQLILRQPVAVAPEDPGMQAVHELQARLHALALDRIDPVALAGGAGRMAKSLREEVVLLAERFLRSDLDQHLSHDATLFRVLALAMQSRLVQSLLAEERSSDRGSMVGVQPRLEAVVERVVERLFAACGLTGRSENRSVELARIDVDLDAALRRELPGMAPNAQRYCAELHLKKCLLDMMFGLGPLQDLLDMEDVTEIMVVHPSLVYIERDGRVIKTNRSFYNDSVLQSIVERIVAPLGRRIDRSQPLVDARTSQGARVNAVIAPLALRGGCLTIRKFRRGGLAAAQLTRGPRRAMTAGAMRLLEAAVRSRRNIVVAGGTGSGKTTLLNVLSAFIPGHERIVTIEDAAELQLRQEHVVSLETRPANSEGRGEYTIRDLLKNALRMRPDRIIVGECRGAEALDMVQAMNTGHAGSMTTVHANSALDVLSRLETMLLLAVDMPLQAVRSQLASAIDLVVYIARLKDGSRRCVQIAEVGDLDRRSGEIRVDLVFERVRPHVDHELLPTGHVPTVVLDAVEEGLIAPKDWLDEGELP